MQQFKPEKSPQAIASPSSKDRLACMIGNILEHYDTALFGLLAPFIAPYFFEGLDPVTALILTYSILPLGFISRFLGSFVFGWIGDRFGRKQALFYSLLGTAIVTFLIGCLPTCQTIGALAPIFLALSKMFQSFFAAGESTGGAVFVLEESIERKRGLMSGWYSSSSLLGVLLASSLVTLAGFIGDIAHHWRLFFWGGSVTAIFGLFLRRNLTPQTQKAPPNNTPKLHILHKYKKALLAIMIACGFSHTTYSLAFTLMNGYVPLITPHSKVEMIQINTPLLIVDLLLLPLFGALSDRIGKEKVMLIGCSGSALLAIPLFACLNEATLVTIILVRLSIIVFGVAFGAPYYAWAIEQVPSHHRYLLLSVASALGSQLIGAPTAALALWFYQILGWKGAPGLYLLIIGLMSGLVILWSMKRSPEMLGEEMR